MNFHKGDIVHYGPGMTRFEVKSVEGNRVRIQYPVLGYELVKDADLLTMVQAAPRMEIVKSDRPQNPPYINVRVKDLAPGDMVVPGGDLRRNARKPLAIIGMGSLQKDGRMPWNKCDLILDGFVHTWVADVQMVQVWGGPKWEQRNNPMQVSWNPVLRLFRWDGTQEGAAA